ncbi:MAG TPA: WbqC family protein [Ignavibacteriales bacterium]|nr:WbqC family protein [Ignavibacteriales bacterium]
MKIAILQPNYIPWKGYFDIINMVDIFVLYDDVQYTVRDWRNRNKIKTKFGTQWLTIPCDGTQNKIIKDVKVIWDEKWNFKHWKTIEHNYCKANYFKSYKEFFAELYCNLNENYLWEINLKFIESINSLLGIKTKIILSSELNYNRNLKKSERLLDILKYLGATNYLSGPSAKEYILEDLFTKENIKIEWMDYNNYPTYDQLYPPFVHVVSIIDLIFNVGEQSQLYLKSFNKF